MNPILSLVSTLFASGLARAEDDARLPPAADLLARYRGALGGAQRLSSQVVHSVIRLDGTAAAGTSTEHLKKDRYRTEVIWPVAPRALEGS